MIAARIDSQPSRALGRAAELLRAARRAVALTGAGLSTPSGIPDFRSPESGLWHRFDPGIASLTRFRYDPEGFFARLRPLAAQMLAAVPNAAHRALARLEAAGRLVGIITQNVDLLHQRAGSKDAVEVHGSARLATCIVCYREEETEPHLEAFVARGVIPRCRSCGGILKPNVVLFGEELPRRAFDRARAWCEQADLILVAGSSLEVTPVCLLPSRALDGGARLIIVNREATYLDERAEAVVHADVVDALPLLAAQVLDA